MEENNNALGTAQLIGKTIVKCDTQMCDTCPNEAFDCVKLICSGGHVCLWG